MSNGLPPVTDLCTPGAPAVSSMQFMRCDNTALLLCIAVSWHLAMSYNVPSRPLLWIILAPPGCRLLLIRGPCPEIIKFVFLVIITLSGYFLAMQSFCICWLGPCVLDNVMECDEKISIYSLDEYFNVGKLMYFYLRLSFLSWWGKTFSKFCVSNELANMTIDFS